MLVCQQKWAGMDGFALRVRERVIERGKRGTDVEGHSLMGLIFIAFSLRYPFFFPPSSLPLLTILLSIRCHLFLGSDEDVCCRWNTCFTNLMNLVACIRNNKASVVREF